MDRRTAVAGAFSLVPGFAFAASAKGTSDDSASMADKFARTLTAHDVPSFAGLFAESYRNHQTSAAAPPPPSGKSMKQGTVDYFTARLIGIPDLVVTIETVLVVEGRIAASFVYSGTHGGVLYGVPPTGKKLRFTSCDIFTVLNGQFVEHWGMGDIAGVIAQLKG